MNFPFTKYEGLGNDFLVVDAKRTDQFSTAEVARICDRRLGVGGDGILLCLPGDTSHAARMKVLNADGSVPEMCGNGIRCLALHVALSEPKAEKRVFSIMTDAGSRECTLTWEGDRAQVQVDMGIVTIGERFSIDLDPYGVVEGVCVDAGNPHAILTRDEAFFGIPDKADAIGRAIETHVRFPHGTNVEFAEQTRHGINLVVWERGVGRTLACGTGACATAMYAASTGMIPYGEVEVHLPGGTLRIHTSDNGRVIMRGPARRVYSGDATL